MKTNYFDIVAINDISPSDSLVYLLKYDSVYGRFPKQIEVKEGYMKIGKKKILLTKTHT